MVKNLTSESFHLHAPYEPAGDQPQAIEALVRGLDSGSRDQTLLGVTGSGKTYTMAKIIEKVNRPTLIISHNKTLAAQLYQEFRDYFPDNAVSYFVSYYDYYQPEAYIPQTDTYIEKETEINEDIDRLRLSATTDLLTRPDTIVIASVSCIYNIGSPKEYGQFILELRTGMHVSAEQIMSRLVELQYERNDWDFHRGTFRLRGEAIDLYPSYHDEAFRITLTNGMIEELSVINPLKGDTVRIEQVMVIYPSKHYMTNPKTYKAVFAEIQKDLSVHCAQLKSQGRLIEAQRLETRVTHDLEMIGEIGYVNGIENYSRYFEGRAAGDPPFTLLDYMKESTGRFYPKSQRDDWLLFIDESHMTIPQIRGMYHGDRSRKQTLIDYGFRLPSALDNRPLTFDEFLRRRGKTIYVSATPSDWELSRSTAVVEQLVRPTGLLDPTVDIRPSIGQIDDLTREIQARAQNHERVLVTTLTKRMAEDLTDYLQKKGVAVEYLHSDILTLDRSVILTNLRRGDFDVVVGVNLLREGLDLPEVSLVAILDADKEGFLRNKTSLIQTMGRAARHVKGSVILYADHDTKSMQAAVSEVGRRRRIQEKFNNKHHIAPTSIKKPVRNPLVNERPAVEPFEADEKTLESLTPKDRVDTIKKLRIAMRQASAALAFEQAAKIRDMISKLENKE